ncbi:SDR family oxidoreductase [Bacillus sp. NEB1478]|uniref:SDR family oxidoreductase n=1 Tax=Bacillus sp. NEB1478 TaxID=3073816 RepID=UPI002872C767|nr:SDR family oxidoreductase [Bacillus sp. NEB1478]WNB91090.1 SDR family oxidoreductase [Bacillus sp. NEB1478]
MTNDQKIALVTGGNRGIGFELSKQLAENGFHVLLGCRDLEKGNAAAARLKVSNLNVAPVELDVHNPDTLQKAVRFVGEQYGRLDVLINNAGVFRDGNHSLIELPAGVLEGTMNTNFFGPYHMIRAFLPLMERNNYGRIINVSSGFGQMREMRHPGHGSYKISKYALNGLTQVLASEVSGNIKINAVCPGWVRTDMGGPNAPRSVEEAAQSILWLTEIKEDGPNGGFFRDGEEISW